jgi:hypothetical protein
MAQDREVLGTNTYWFSAAQALTISIAPFPTPLSCHPRGFFPSTAIACPCVIRLTACTQLTKLLWKAFKSISPNTRRYHARGSHWAVPGCFVAISPYLLHRSPRRSQSPRFPSTHTTGCALSAAPVSSQSVSESFR